MEFSTNNNGVCILIPQLALRNEELAGSAIGLLAELARIPQVKKNYNN